MAFRVGRCETRTRVSNATLSFAASSSVVPSLTQFTPEANIHAFDNDHAYLQLTPAQHYLRQDTVTHISDEHATQIECDTKGQAVSKLWHADRAKRITASRFGRICKMTERTDATKLAASLQEQNIISAAPLEYGRKHESNAIYAYCNKTSNNVTPSGLVVCTERPYLACSPDGIIDEATIVEVKCPYSSRDKRITPVTVPYLKSDDNGKVVLHDTHDYMYQVQGSMFITGTSMCHLVIFTLVDLVVVDVPYNGEFVNGEFVTEMLAKLDYFLF